MINVRSGASRSLVTIASENADLREAVETALYAELARTRSAWEYGAPVLGALKDRRAVPQLTTILNQGNWRDQTAAANAVAEIAAVEKINEKELSDALIKAGQSETLQVQEACDKALRAMTKVE